jgi:hypothetical protein
LIFRSAADIYNTVKTGMLRRESISIHFPQWIFFLLCGDFGYGITGAVLHACEDFFAMCCLYTIQPVTCCAEGSNVNIALVQKKVWWPVEREKTKRREFSSQQSCCVLKFDTDTSRNFQTPCGVPVYLWNWSDMKASSVQPGSLEEDCVILLSNGSLFRSWLLFKSLKFYQWKA